MLTKFSLSAPKEKQREPYGEYAYWYYGENGFNSIYNIEPTHSSSTGSFNVVLLSPS